MLMSIGMFVFSLPTVVYQDFKRQTAYRHGSQNRIGKRPASQFMGEGDDTITLQGWAAGELSRAESSIDTLRMMASQGEAWPLIEGTGKIYGLWVIENIEEGKSIFFKDGAARRTEFTISLKRVDDDRVDMLGSLIALGLSFLR